jgi:hypothetical protein
MLCSNKRNSKIKLNLIETLLIFERFFNLIKKYLLKVGTVIRNHIWKWGIRDTKQWNTFKTQWAREIQTNIQSNSNFIVYT